MEDAENLLNENTRLVYFVLRRYFPSLVGDQDLVQEGFVGLWIASLKYDGRVKFSTFAVACIRNAMLAYLRRQRRSPSTISLDAPFGNADSNGTCCLGDLLEDSTTSAFELEVFADDFLQRLTPQDRKFIGLRIDGMTQQALGEAAGISQVAVSRRLKKIKSLYEKVGGISHAE